MSYAKAHAKRNAGAMISARLFLWALLAFGVSHSLRGRLLTPDPDRTVEWARVQYGPGATGVRAIALVDGELLSQGEVLEREVTAVADERGHGIGE